MACKSRILDAEGAGSGVMDLQGQWCFWAMKCGDFGVRMESIMQSPNLNAVESEVSILLFLE